MRKVLGIILAFALVFSMLSLFACTEGNGSQNEETKDPALTDPATDGSDSSAETDPVTDEVTEAPPETDPVIVKPDPPEEGGSQFIFVKTFLADTFEASNGVTLPYRYRLPDNYSEEYAYPVLLFLHGAGERGTDNDSQIQLGIQNMFMPKELPTYNCFVIAPQCPNEDGWNAVDWSLGSYSVDEHPMTAALSAVLELLDYFNETYSTNLDRQYVTGLSMGGYGTWDLVCRYPDRFAAAVPLCGGGDPSKAELLKDLPIHIYHDKDDTSVPVQGSRDMYEALIAAGSEVVLYTESEGRGHNVWDLAYREPDMIKWMFAQRRNSDK